MVAFPGAGDRRRAVRADRVLQPAGDHGPGRAAGVLRATRPRGPGRMGRVPGRVRPGAPAAVAGRSTPGTRRRARRPLPDLEFIAEGDVNLYVYPEVADYRRESAARALLAPARLLGAGDRRGLHAAARARRPATGALIYFSLGSLGSADVGLMRRVIGCLAATPHRYIVSKGPLHAEIELAPNMWGAEFVPQTSILPLVDLVITHGGNNTTTECLHFGKPMIVLPLFWDQYDNAQRMDELGLGVRLDHLPVHRRRDARRAGPAAGRRAAARPPPPPPGSSSNGTGCARPPPSSRAPPGTGRRAAPGVEAAGTG